jgi:hypothetical protein
MTALVPEGTPRRLLAAATLLTMLGYGIYLTAGVLYFTQGLHLPAGEVGLGMSAAGAVALAAGIPLGHVADRLGAREVHAVILVIGCGAMVGLCVTRSFWPFLACATIIAISQSAGPAARGPLIAKYGGDRPAAFRSYLRALSNVGIAVGALAAGWAVEENTRVAYVLVLAASAVAWGVSAVVAAVMPSVPPLRAGPGPRWIALRDRPYVVLTVLDGLMAIQYRVLTVAVPLWLLRRTVAPHWSVSAVMLLNTAIVVFLQVRASRNIDSVPAGGRAFRRAGVAFLVSCAAISLLAGLPGWLCVVVLLAAVAVHTMGEMWQAAGGFELSFALAPDESVGQYQGLFGMGLGLGVTVGPAVLIALCIGLGRPGWWIVGAGFALTGLAVPAAARWAERTRPAPVQPAPQTSHIAI